MLRRRVFVLGLGASFVSAACGAAEGPAPIVGPVVVNFFATWCGPCRKELPAFQLLAERYADRDLTFLLVDMQEDPDAVAVFLSELRVTLPAVVDSSGEVAKSYRVRGLPSTFFIGRDGVIRQAQLGELDERLLEAGIANIV